MKPESLHALVIDQHSGELSPEAVELLEAYLAANPLAREEAARIEEVLQLTRETVARHPACVSVFSPVESKPARPVRRPWQPPLWLRVAAVLAFSALTAAAGFYVGRTPAEHMPSASIMAAVTPAAPRKDSPWARYRMAPDPLGSGLQVVRVDYAEREAQP